jgi:hypothetical protein
MMSVSNSPDLGAMRMGEQHFEEALKEIVRHLLARGATLAYGGDLRKQGFTRMLFDLARTYNATDHEGGPAKIRNYLACTVWENLGEARAVERAIRREYAGAADVQCLPPPETVRDCISGEILSIGEDRPAAALTDMRCKIIDDSDAVVFLGGRVTGYAGRYPGVLDEVALSLHQDRPIYLLGGYGGCTGDAAHALYGMSAKWGGAFTPHYMRPQEQDNLFGYRQAINKITTFADRMPDNGLNHDDNAALAVSSDIRVIIPLLLRGLRTVAERR